jgi:hypothetical protein
LIFKSIAAAATGLIGVTPVGSQFFVAAEPADWSESLEIKHSSENLSIRRLNYHENQQNSCTGRFWKADRKGSRFRMIYGKTTIG